MHVWYVDAGIEDTPELVYTRCLVLSCLFYTTRTLGEGRGGKRQKWGKEGNGHPLPPVSGSVNDI